MRVSVSVSACTLDRCEPKSHTNDQFFKPGTLADGRGKRSTFGRAEGAAQVARKPGELLRQIPAQDELKK
jgi:hypothetical protein